MSLNYSLYLIAEFTRFHQLTSIDIAVSKDQRVFEIMEDEENSILYMETTLVLLKIRKHSEGSLSR